MSLMRSGVGTACPLTLDFLLDFEEACLFFLAVVEVEEVCVAPGWPAPDTTGAALTRSAVPNINSKVCLIIICQSSRATARELERRRQGKPCRTGRCPIAA